ncbi:hypothetical protein ACN42_g11715, partial [Penicillium freii]
VREFYICQFCIRCRTRLISVSYEPGFVPIKICLQHIDHLNTSLSPIFGDLTTVNP